MWQRPAAGARYGIALDLGDLDLRDALAEAIEGHPALALAEPGDADAAISGPPPGAGGRGPVLRVGSGPLPADAAPELILSAAHVVAAGLRLVAADPVPA